METDDASTNLLRPLLEIEHTHTGREFGVLRCDLVPTGDPLYLHVRYPVGEHYAELLLPHSCVALIVTDVPNRTLGFFREAQTPGQIHG
jgi:hypothetical protein